MSVQPREQARLLDLQGIDQRTSALTHRRNSHPSISVLKELAGRADDLRRAAVGQGAVVSDIEREVARIEGDIEKVRTRRATQQGRLDRNEVPLRDVSPMQHEIARMDARIGDLENEQVDAEERLEAARGALDAMKSEGAAIAADVEAAKASFAEDMVEVEAELAELTRAREELVASLPADLVDDYEYARTRNGALAVLEIRDGVPQGVARDMSPAELERVRLTPADELAWTEDTSQIIVRTSGADNE